MYPNFNSKRTVVAEQAEQIGIGPLSLQHTLSDQQEVVLDRIFKIVSRNLDSLNLEPIALFWINYCRQACTESESSHPGIEDARTGTVSEN